MTDYLAYMKKSLISCLQDVKLPNTNETLKEENFDSYIEQLSTLCMDNQLTTGENNNLYHTVKQAMQGIQVS